MRGVKRKNEDSVIEENIKEKEETKKNVCKIGGVILKPYVGKEELPKEKLDSKGNVINPGEPRFFLTRGNDCHKLMKIYRAKGIKRCLVRVLKVKKRNEQGAKDREIYQTLKKGGISGGY